MSTCATGRSSSSKQRLNQVWKFFGEQRISIALVSTSAMTVISPHQAA